MIVIIRMDIKINIIYFIILLIDNYIENRGLP